MPLRLGLIGLGEVAQLIHLPILARLPHLFALAAAYDPSPSVAAAVGQRWNIGKHHQTIEALLADPTIDAVMVLSPDQYHGRHARAALGAGKHVLLEKPACLTRADLLETLAVAENTDRVAMVGYMRRYAPAFIAAKREVQKLTDISYVRVQDVICEGPWYFGQVGPVIVPQNDVPPEQLAESRTLRSEMIASVCGSGAPQHLLAAYSVLTGLSSHGLSAMRDILGRRPERVIAAAIKQQGIQITALLDYGSFTALYECLIGDVVRFDAGMEINTPRRRIAFKYPTPYIRNLPMTLELQETAGHDNTVTTLGPFHQDPFEAELRAFHAACTTGGPNATPLADSLDDLDLFAEIIARASL